MEIEKNYIVITTINPPTEAVVKFAALSNYHLIVVGDRKTDAVWQHPNVHYIAVTSAFATAFAQVLPYNHYCRKMLGYVYALQQGATSIIDTDDDNIPYNDWAFPHSTHHDVLTTAPNTYINIYEYFTSMKIWPRGLPLHLINTNTSTQATLTKANTQVGIWQGLANEDPDVDAIYRLTNNTPCYFEQRSPIVLSQGAICPYNSQNTWYTQALFPLLYLPVTVTFRFTDILRGIVAQPILWAAGYQLGFTHATVLQKRNAHNFFKDFESEIPMYTQLELSYNIALENTSNELTVAQNLLQVYTALHKHNIVQAHELVVLQAWLSYFE